MGLPSRPYRDYVTVSDTGCVAGSSVILVGGCAIIVIVRC